MRASSFSPKSTKSKQTNAEKLRKARQRLAQRSYRSRKQGALLSAQARAAQLEASLGKALRSFTQLQNYVSQKKQQSLPPDIVLALSKTGVELAAIAQQARSESPPISAPQPATERSKVSVLDDFDWRENGWQSILSPDINEVHRNIEAMSLVDRLIQACFGRARSALSYWASTEGLIPSPLLLPLRVGDSEILVGIGATKITDLADGSWGDGRYDQKTLNAMPKMLRIVEGEQVGAIPREAPPRLQRLKYGRTRTILRTTLPHLQGEFLEARDVEEYLEERGIFVRGARDVVKLALPSHEGGHREDGHEIADWSIFGHPGEIGLPIPSGKWNFTPPVGQYDIFTEGRGLPRDGFEQAPTAAIGLTISVDRLVKSLAMHATCLGPAPGIRKANVDCAIRESVMSMAEGNLQVRE